MPIVSVVTGTRAEYGLLRPVLQRLFAEPGIEARLVVTGAHLSMNYGYTLKEIEADGYPVHGIIDFLAAPAPEGRAGTAKHTSDALFFFNEYFQRPENRPDLVLLLGDRYEILAAAMSAGMLDIPVAHISGGDVTRGADDDWFRHCITKIAKLHFPSCEEYRRRVIRMGEAPDTVFNVGGLGDENIRRLPLLERDALEKQLGLALPAPYALVTFHPETATGIGPDEQADALLAAMEAHPQLFYLITMANADAGGMRMNARYAAFCEGRDNAALFSSLGVLRYLSAMRYAALVLGNSSSGVVETPSLGVPTVDIGARQQGRATGENVIHCAMDTGAVSAAMQRALTPEFAALAKQAKSPYNGGDTSAKIVEILKQKLAGGSLLGPKAFYDAGKEWEA